ncbi:MAG: Mur ligase domain-containing protein [Bacillales bacterium]|nr:Mur ligase domain-containing protein [Bacillales bacterium]
MQFYFIGIKGSGMASLASIIQDDGFEVTGSDIEKELLTDNILKKRNIHIHSLDDESYLNSDVIIIGHNFYKEKLLEKLDLYDKLYFEYNEFIGFYLNFKKTISICGSHGKTTLVNILSTIDTNSSFLRGDGEGFRNKNESLFYLESCEYKEHFLKYKPKEIIITNIDYDHTDYYKCEMDYINAFQKFVKNSSKIYIPYQDKDKIVHNNKITYGMKKEAIYRMRILRKTKSFIYFEVYYKDVKLGRLKCLNYGNNYALLVLASIACYYENYHNLNNVEENLLRYLPSHQRFEEYKIKGINIVLDYAHHYAQINNNLDILKIRYPLKKRVAIFRPDRISRLISFKNEYINVLSKFDEAYVLPLPNNKENEGNDANMICFNNIKYINDISNIKFEKNKVYSFMSSKPFFNELSKIKKGKNLS